MSIGVYLLQFSAFHFESTFNPPSGDIPHSEQKPCFTHNSSGEVLKTEKQLAGQGQGLGKL